MVKRLRQGTPFSLLTDENKTLSYTLGNVGLSDPSAHGSVEQSQGASFQGPQLPYRVRLKRQHDQLPIAFKVACRGVVGPSAFADALSAVTSDEVLLHGDSGNRVEGV